MNRKSVAILSLCLAAMPGLALAVPILQGPTDAATGIAGLEIDGTTYDVTFSTGDISYDAFFGGDTPTFLGTAADMTASQNAAIIVAAFLEASGVTSVTNMDILNPGDEFRVLFVPAFITVMTGPDLVTAANVVYNGTSWANSGFGRTGSGPINPSSVAWVRFTPIAVPEPGTLVLFSMGIAGAALLARRRKRHR